MTVRKNDLFDTHASGAASPTMGSTIGNWHGPAYLVPWELRYQNVTVMQGYQIKE